MASSPLRTILAATTLTRESDAVVAAASALARASGARLHVLHAMLLPLEYDDLPGGGGAAWPMTDAYATLEPTLRAHLDDQLRRLAIPPESLAAAEIVDGTPWRVIRARAAAVDADLVVVGATDKPDLADRLLGSTATHVLAGADRPVLVIRGRPTMPPQRVLTPVDLSPLAGDAFALAGALVAAAAGATRPTIRALFVLDPMQRTAGIQFSPEQMDRFAADELARFVDLHRPRGDAVTIEPIVRIGQPRDAIEAEAAAWPADVVAIGTHGYSGWDRRIFGSVAGDITHHGPCSVLVLPAVGHGG